ncbi:MAG: hypothetical protein Q4C50_03290 [Eubacteriales bacterium]|nr:hypothetical protein [Eubacteriales bacterium]
MNNQTLQQKKNILLEDIRNGIDELDSLIKEYENTGKVPIEGFYFDVRYVSKLSQSMHHILDGNDTDYEAAAELINLQLLSASKYWRLIRHDLEMMYLD